MVPEPWRFWQSHPAWLAPSQPLPCLALLYRPVATTLLPTSVLGLTSCPLWLSRSRYLVCPIVRRSKDPWVLCPFTSGSELWAHRGQDWGGQTGWPSCPFWLCSLALCYPSSLHLACLPPSHSSIQGWSLRSPGVGLVVVTPTNPWGMGLRYHTPAPCLERWVGVR